MKQQKYAVYGPWCDHQGVNLLNRSSSKCQYSLGRLSWQRVTTFNGNTELEELWHFWMPGMHSAYLFNKQQQTRELPTVGSLSYSFYVVKVHCIVCCFFVLFCFVFFFCNWGLCFYMLESLVKLIVFCAMTAACYIRNLSIMFLSQNYFQCIYSVGFAVNTECFLM